MGRRLHTVRRRLLTVSAWSQPGRDLAAFGCGAAVTAAFVGVAWPAGVAAVLASTAVLWASARRRPRRVGPTADEHWCDVAREMERSRRLGTPLTLVRLACGHGEGGLTAADMVARARPGMRATEGLFADGGDAYIVVPQPRVAAQQVLRRLVDSLGLDPAVIDEARFSTFPTDGLTLTALVEQLVPDEGRVARFKRVAQVEDGTAAAVV